ncbi:glycoside hydrolase family 70 protein [Ligilactobacillus faecis]|uniref:dextransucrase n=1 Tax=Ligilactobacillus faecis TaxID=762833 RepID=A0ABV4DQD6_9LACO
MKFEIKKRFKMYKAGKNWVVAPLIFVGIGLGMTITAPKVLADSDNAQTVVTTTNDTKTDAPQTKAETDTAQELAPVTTDTTATKTADKTTPEEATETSETKEKEATTETTTATPNETVSVQADPTTQASVEKQTATTEKTEPAQVSQVKQDGNWYLVDDKTGDKLTGFQEIKDQNKTVYYSPASGQMQYGWQNIDNNVHYFDTFDGAMAIGQKKINDHWYLFNEQGQMQRGLQDLTAYGEPKTAYYNQDGWMQYGWQNIDNNAHYFDKYDGAMAVGQKKIDNHWYLFNKQGQMQRGLQDLTAYGEPKTAYYNQDGWMQYGWQWVNNATRYFDTFNGAMTTGQRLINGHWYLFDQNGAMQRGLQTIKNQNKTVYYNQDGWMKYGWQWVNNATRYFDTFNGAMTTGQQKINGHWYLFDQNGAMQRGYQYIPEQQKIVYYNQDGWMLYGKQKIAGTTQNFDTYNGALKATGQQKIGDHWYLFGKDGKVLTGFQEIKDQNKIVYYSPKTAQMQYGQQKIADHWYNFDTYTGAMKTGFVAIPEQNKTVYYATNGQMQYGKQKIANNWYYFDTYTGAMNKGDIVLANEKLTFDKETGALKTGLQTIEGNTYYVDPIEGKYARNFLLNDNDTWYYFDANGLGKVQLATNFIPAKDATDSDFAKGNQLYSYDLNSIENVDGYLTADSWYRPKMILRQGKTWESSTATDKRPILMTWWPSAQIKANYLNYMADQGVIANGNYTQDSDPAQMQKAAEEVQKNLEVKIAAKGNETEWLRELMSNFIKQQSIWNKDTEVIRYDGMQFQGGFLKYGNSDLVPNTKSDWRLLGRQPINIDGKGTQGAEFLLANDIDNSNPIVQAEQLNWLHYLLNFGTITAGDDQANFDGYRVDAVDNVDADLLKIAGDYMNAAYKTDQSDQQANRHLSILEDWNINDAAYTKTIGVPQLSIDNHMVIQLAVSLSKAPGQNDRLGRFIEWNLVDRSNDDSENEAIPNFIFVRAHDNSVQAAIQDAITDTTGAGVNQFDWDQLAQGLETYYADQASTTKKYNRYNIVSSYAMILTNKDTVPRIYYGDLFHDGGQYMSGRSIYYDAIDNLLRSRVKYVAGGQTMAVDQNDIMTSVRFGKGAMKASDLGTAETRTQGIGMVLSNKTDLHLNDGEKVVLHMGAAHKNQAYRAVLLTTDDGLMSYASDENAPVVYTDDNGDLIFSGQDVVVNGTSVANTSVRGVANPFVTGYLAVWVPVGASADQDARTQAGTELRNDGQTFRSNAALDSNVIYEGFSNFQSMPTKPEEYTNAIIAKNVDLFKQWGITSFEFAPQYRSSEDGTFLDSVINNGYAFTDRYDLGFEKPTKYGTDQDLRDAIRALHAAGIQAIADWVPDQVYNLPEQEVVMATRVNDHGVYVDGAPIKDTLYVANSKGGGKYQAQYGGEFLQELQEKYPELFKEKQVSTGVAMDPSVKIKEWSAKYMNGTNILGRGAGYVLRASEDGPYFNIATQNVILPGELQTDDQGFIQDTKGNIRYIENGKYAHDQFIKDDAGNWYYFDHAGNMVKEGKNDNGFVVLDDPEYGGAYFFMNNGVSFRNGFMVARDGATYYFDANGRMIKGKTVTIAGRSYSFDVDGRMI